MMFNEYYRSLKVVLFYIHPPPIRPPHCDSHQTRLVTQSAQVDAQHSLT